MYMCTQCAPYGQLVKVTLMYRYKSFCHKCWFQPSWNEPIYACMFVGGFPLGLPQFLLHQLISWLISEIIGEGHDLDFKKKSEKQLYTFYN